MVVFTVTEPALSAVAAEPDMLVTEPRPVAASAPVERREASRSRGSHSKLFHNMFLQIMMCIEYIARRIFPADGDAVNSLNDGIGVPPERSQMAEMTFGARSVAPVETSVSDAI